MEEKKEGPYTRREGERPNAREGSGATQQGTENVRYVFALQYMGDTFTGEKSHGEAFDRLRARYPEYDEKLVIQGYTTPTGGFLTREEMKRRSERNT